MSHTVFVFNTIEIRGKDWNHKCSARSSMLLAKAEVVVNKTRECKENRLMV